MYEWNLGSHWLPSEEVAQYFSGWGIIVTGNAEIRIASVHKGEKLIRVSQLRLEDGGMNGTNYKNLTEGKFVLMWHLEV